jgi:hypothetical protein
MRAGKHRWAWEDVPCSGTVTVPLSVSLVVAQRLRKLDFPVKASEEPRAPGADKNHFLRPRVPGEDTKKVSAPETWGQSPALSGSRVASGVWYSLGNWTKRDREAVIPTLSWGDSWC